MAVYAIWCVTALWIATIQGSVQNETRQVFDAMLQIPRHGFSVDYTEPKVYN